MRGSRVIVGEMWRHCKAVVTFGDTGRAALDAIGLPASGVGVITADDRRLAGRALAERPSSWPSTGCGTA